MAWITTIVSSFHSYTIKIRISELAHITKPELAIRKIVYCPRGRTSLLVRHFRGIDIS